MSSFAATALSCLRNDVVLFSGLDFRLEGGAILQIQGPNGSGKTSLIRMLCGLAMPEAGEILWNERNIYDQRQEYFNDMSYIGHVNGVKTELTALENLTLAAALAGRSNGCSPRDALEQMGLADYENTPALKLSTGQRRRLALARLLIADTGLWILDEPLTALDDYGRQLMRDMISTHAVRNGITVLATHDPLNYQQHKITVINL
jgi:heme exporter protein A